MAWKDLNIRQRAGLMNVMINNGITALADMKTLYDNYLADGGEIHIKPSRRGTFTAAAERHGKSVQAFASQVLAGKDDYSPAMVKKANFARNASHWKHDDGGYNWTPDVPKEPLYKLDLNPEFRVVHSNGNHEYSFDDFRSSLLTPERRVKWKIQRFKGWDDDDLRYLYNSLSSTGWDPRVAAYALVSETGLNPYNNSSVSSAVGLGQLTKDELKRMYPDTYEEVHKAYIDKTRSIRDNINDAIAHYKYLHDRLSTEPDYMGYGRLKVNLLAKNSSLDSPVPEIVWKNSLTKAQREHITPGVSTYRDLAKMYDEEYEKHKTEK